MMFVRWNPLGLLSDQMWWEVIRKKGKLKMMPRLFTWETRWFYHELKHKPQ